MRYIDPQWIMQKRLEYSYKDTEKPDWDIAIICFKGIDGTELLIDKLQAVPVDRRILSGLYNPGGHPYVYESNNIDTRIVIVGGCWWGGPQAAIIIEELACIGVKYIIGLGLAGSISRDLPRGTHIVASKGFTTDGTSKAYYKGDSIDADVDLLKLLQSTKFRLKKEIVPANIVTYDAIYQETDEVVKEWISLGAQAVNMETTPLYAVSKVCGIRSLWLGYISDCLRDNEWENWLNLPDSLDEESANIAIDLIHSLYP